MKSLRRNKKAVSDVIAVLLMIAIAVAASLIAYAWVMGYLGGTTGKVGKAIQIQSIANDTTNANKLAIYVQNVGDGPVTIQNLYVNGVLDPTFTNSTSLTLQKSATVALYASAWPTNFKSTDTVDVKVVCADGTPVEATQTVQGAVP